MKLLKSLTLSWPFVISIASIFLFSSIETSAQVKPWNPPAEKKVRVVGTGNTTGNIANVSVTNNTSQAQNFTVGPFYIPSDGTHQSYVVPGSSEVTVPPSESITIPIIGFCADVHKPPVGVGRPMPSPSSWLIPEVNFDPGSPPSFSVLSSSVKIVDKKPGGVYINNIPVGSVTVSTNQSVTVDADEYPKQAAQFIFDAINRITATYDELKAEGLIFTPFSGNSEKERESVIQQTIWIYSAALSGDEYTKEQFSTQLENQFSSNTGRPIASASEADKLKFDQGVDDFWATFNLVGVEAKVISMGSESTGSTVKEESRDQSKFPPIENVIGIDTINGTVKGTTGGALKDGVDAVKGAKIPDPEDRESCICGEFSMSVHIKTSNGNYDRHLEVLSEYHKDDEEGSDITKITTLYADDSDLKIGEQVEIVLSDIIFECPCKTAGNCESYQPKTSMRDEKHPKAEKGSHGIYPESGSSNFRVVKNSKDNKSFTIKATWTKDDVGHDFQHSFSIQQVCESAVCKKTRCTRYIIIKF